VYRDFQVCAFFPAGCGAGAQHLGGKGISVGGGGGGIKKACWAGPIPRLRGHAKKKKKKDGGSVVRKDWEKLGGFFPWGGTPVFL